MSGVSPAASFCWITAGFATVNTTRCALSRANFAASCFATSAGAPELKMRMSAAQAALTAMKKMSNGTQRTRDAAIQADLSTVGFTATPRAS